MSGHPPSGPPYWPPQYPTPPPGSYPPPPGSYPPPPGSYPSPPGSYHPPGQYPDYGTAPPPYWVPGTIMMPYPVAPVSQPHLPESQPTYITNYIYQGEAPSSTTEPVQVAETGDFEWIPTTSTTAHTLQGRAVIGGHEGWDGSPLWIIRAWHSGDLIPGKLSIRHYSATVVYDGKEIPVQNIEVLCTQPENLRWVPASNGMVPPGAIPGGRTATGEVLYIGRSNYQLSLTPGKIHPSHRACYIGFAGREVTLKIYDVLCRPS